MKSIFTSAFTLTFLLLIHVTSISWSQKQSRLPGKGVQAADGCLACPGSEWNDASNITQVDGQFATTTMTENGFCFQTVCFYTRGLIASDFGFDIPATATIDGIVVRVNRKTDVQQAVKDSFVQLFDGFSPVGAKKKANVFWPTTATVRAYGGSTDLWGKAWTPADINNPDFGVWLKCYNKSNKQPQASVDYIKMTVYFHGNGKLSHQEITFEPDSKKISVYPNPAGQSITLNAILSPHDHVSISIVNSSGTTVMNFDKEVGNELYSQQINLSSLPAGAYIIRIESAGQILTKSFLKE